MTRPIETDYAHHHIFANDRADVWLHDRKSGTNRNLTQGAADRSDFWASMPGKAHEYHKLLNGVLPAVDAVLAAGIADNERLAVMGQSNGGFSTYALITLTNRFKAAVAIAGMTDFLSIALQFEPSSLPRDVVEMGGTSGRLSMLESYMGFGLSWRSQLNLLNSPIAHIDNVQTPILQLHGDFDGVPIAQAEEYFTALQRLGKRAKLIKYIGDDHVFHSPANISDSWQQIVGWLDEFTAAPGAKDAT